jgi:hypothetical protein
MQSPSKIVVLGTGGTIAGSAASPDDAVSYRAGALPIAGLLADLPVPPGISLESEQVAQLDSKDMDFATWRRLAERAALHLARSEVSAVVVTHGTDTLEETAYFLDLTVADPRPVVVTGAMRPADGVGIDGPMNLLSSVRVAANPASRGRGAMVLLNDEILAARDATKMNTVRPNAFVAPYRGDLGVADPERIVFHREAHRAGDDHRARVGHREVEEVRRLLERVGAVRDHDAREIGVRAQRVGDAAREVEPHRRRDRLRRHVGELLGGERRHRVERRHRLEQRVDADLPLRAGVVVRRRDGAASGDEVHARPRRLGAERRAEQQERESGRESHAHMLRGRARER